MQVLFGSIGPMSFSADPASEKHDFPSLPPNLAPLEAGLPLLGDSQVVCDAALPLCIATYFSGRWGWKSLEITALGSSQTERKWLSTGAQSGFAKFPLIMILGIIFQSSMSPGLSHVLRGRAGGLYESNAHGHVSVCRTGLPWWPLKVSRKLLEWRTDPWARRAGSAVPHLLGPLLGVASSLWLSQGPDCCTCMVPKGSGRLGNLSH